MARKNTFSDEDVMILKEKYIKFKRVTPTPYPDDDYYVQVTVRKDGLLRNNIIRPTRYPLVYKHKGVFMKIPYEYVIMLIDKRLDVFESMALIHNKAVAEGVNVSKRAFKSFARWIVDPARRKFELLEE